MQGSQSLNTSHMFPVWFQQNNLEGTDTAARGHLPLSPGEGHMAMHLPHEIWTSVTILSGLGNFAGMAASLLMAIMILFHRVSSG